MEPLAQALRMPTPQSLYYQNAITELHAIPWCSDVLCVDVVEGITPQPRGGCRNCRHDRGVGIRGSCRWIQRLRDDVIGALNCSYSTSILSAVAAHRRATTTMLGSYWATSALCVLALTQLATTATASFPHRIPIGEKSAVTYTLSTCQGRM